MKKLLLKSKMANQPVDIIYMDRHGRITKRTIFVKSFDDKQIIAFCTLRDQQRAFGLENILAAEKGRLHYETKQTNPGRQRNVGIKSHDASGACRSYT